MVDFMVKHSDLAKGHLKVPDAKNKSNNLWQKLCSDLNTLGPPERDVNGWKKVSLYNECFDKYILKHVFPIGLGRLQDSCQS